MIYRLTPNKNFILLLIKILLFISSATFITTLLAIKEEKKIELKYDKIENIRSKIQFINGFDLTFAQNLPDFSRFIYEAKSLYVLESFKYETYMLKDKELKIKVKDKNYCSRMSIIAQGTSDTLPYFFLKLII